MFSTGPIDGEENLGRHSMTVPSLLAYCIAAPGARIAGSPSADHLLPLPCSQVFDHRRDYGSSWPLFLHTDCCHHAESNVSNVKNREEFTARCILHKAVVRHDNRELWLIVWLSVMWIVCGSGSHAVAAPVAVTRVREHVRGFLRCIRTDGNALSSGFSFPPELVRVVLQAHHSITPNRALSAALSMFQLGARQDLRNHVHQNLLKRALGEPPGCHPFPAFPSSSSGVFVFLHLMQSPRWPWVSC